MDVEVLVFQVAERLYGVRAATVVEVLRAATLSAFPDQPDAVEGLLRLRGTLVPVLSIGRLLNKRAAAMQHNDHLIVVQSEADTVALLVDRAIDLIRIHPDQQVAAQAEAAEAGEADFAWIDLIAKTPRGVVHVLDVPGVLAQPQLAGLVHLVAARSASQEDGT
ncbi:chemotaxis protein CheW [Roseimaritima sediminicola]|uniref:chemotaxis protein CheW n=1 Tax=Roseimaritima sediminicola TaxID=2662066 RepID=UPI001298274B|nr:chemotaxis protein CheW [Roseimaritima sediminicola]